MRKGKLLGFFALFLVILFLFFTNDFGLVDVQHTAIITGLGIDSEGEEILLTADLAVPTSSDEGSDTQPLAISARAKTLPEALEKIGNELGWTPKLVYCGILLLGEEFLSKDVFRALDFFLRDEHFPDNCLVACAKGRAEEIFAMKTPVDNIVSLALSKILTGEAYGAGKCSYMNLKDFAAGYYDETKSGFLPIVKKQDACDSTLKRKEKDSGEENSVFCVTETALFFEGKKVAELDEKETFAVNLLRRRVSHSAYCLHAEGEEYCLDLKKKKANISFCVKNFTPSLTVDVSLDAKITDKNTPFTVGELSTSFPLKNAAETLLEKELEFCYESIFEKSKQSGADVFNLVDKLKCNASKFYSAYRQDVLSRTQTLFRVRVNR